LNLGGVFIFKNDLKKHTFLNLELSGGSKYSGIQFKEKLHVKYDETSSDFEFFSLNLWISPTVRIERIFYNRFGIGFYGGYEFNLNSKIRLIENNKAYLQNSRREPITIDWSGFRMGLSIHFRSENAI
jgi:hypothetical protein